MKADEKAFAICTEMQKGKDGAKGKRKAGDGDDGGVEKKVKAE